MIKSKTLAVAVIAAIALVPAAPALAWGQRDGGYNRGYHGGGPIRGLAGAVVGAAAAVISFPFVVLGAIVQGPRYATGPDYYGVAPSYPAPPAGPAYYGTPPQYYRAPPDARYYAPAPGNYAPPPPAYPAPAYYAPQQAPVYYAPPSAMQSTPPRQTYYSAQRPVYDAPAPYTPPLPADYSYYRQ